MTGDQSFYSRESAEMRRADRCARSVRTRAAGIQIKETPLAPAVRGRSSSVPAGRVPHARGLAKDQPPTCSGGCRILTQVFITTRGIRDISSELGKKKSNRT